MAIFSELQEHRNLFGLLCQAWLALHLIFVHNLLARFLRRFRQRKRAFFGARWCCQFFTGPQVKRMQLANVSVRQAILVLPFVAAAAARTADEFASGLIPVIQAIRATGALTLASIALELNGRGIRSARGGNWHRSSVANLLDRTKS
jgi:hypothetical protein